MKTTKKRANTLSLYSFMNLFPNENAAYHFSKKYIDKYADEFIFRLNEGNCKEF